MPKVSVIVPVFGVEQYIERCARSLFEQTLDDIEYIFVNDCTKDKSIDVLKTVLFQYPLRKSQVKIISHDVNKGLPRARMTGLKYATGEYIAHCDSDDWIDVTMYEKMYAKAKEDNLDMAVCKFYISDGINSIEYIHKDSFSKDGSLYFEYMNIWAKIVKKEIYKNDLIPVEATMLEDRALSVQLAFYSNKIGIIEEPLYYYYQNLNSICRVFTEERCVSRFKEATKNVNLIVSFLEKNNETIKYPVDIARLKYTARHQIAPITNKPVYYQLWKKTYPEINKVILFNKSVLFSEKIRFLLTWAHLFPFFRKYLSR